MATDKQKDNSVIGEDDSNPSYFEATDPRLQALYTQAQLDLIKEFRIQTTGFNRTTLNCLEKHKHKVLAYWVKKGAIKFLNKDENAE